MAAGAEAGKPQLMQLELLGEDQRVFESYLDDIYQVVSASMTSAERTKSWDVISATGWYENICQRNNFRSRDLATIFTLVVIPEFAGQPPAEVLARWAIDAPAPMVDGLLEAAKADGPDSGIS